MRLKKKLKLPIKPYHRIEYKNVYLLSAFITNQGKILPRRATGITLQQQRKISKSIKRARILALLSFITSNHLKILKGGNMNINIKKEKK